MEDQFENNILFETKKQTLKDMTLIEHIGRLQQMSEYLSDTIKLNKCSLHELKQTVKGQTSSLKNAQQVLQNNTSEQLNRLKAIFEPAMITQKQQINDMKKQALKITTQQLTNKKMALNLEEEINRCEIEIGFKDVQLNDI